MYRVLALAVAGPLVATVRFHRVEVRVSQEKRNAIAKYLSDNMSGLQIEQKHDFDRGAQTFKVHAVDGSRLLKVSDEFISDNDILDILRRFDQWKLTDTLLREK